MRDVLEQVTTTSINQPEVGVELSIGDVIYGLRRLSLGFITISVVSRFRNNFPGKFDADEIRYQTLLGA
jgi:hypothetical protein